MLHNKYSSPQPTTTMTKFNVLAFPSNDFHQEKETNEEILSYVQTNFPEVTFPLFSRAPLSSNMVFQLCQKQTQSKVEWNFHKFLVDGDGKCVKSYGHRVQPMDIEEDIVRLIMLEEEKRKSGGAGAGGNGGLQVPVTY
jgi:glutathione peroxidase-family protein